MNQAKKSRKQDRPNASPEISYPVVETFEAPRPLLRARGLVDLALQLRRETGVQDLELDLLLAGEVKLMPGTGSDPAFRRIDVDVNTGKVTGLL